MKRLPLPPPLRRIQPRVVAPDEVVSGPAFPMAVKVLATVMMIALAISGATAMLGQSSGSGLAWRDFGFLMAVSAVVCSGYWGIATSRTRFDGVSIEQSWLWRKKVNLAEITQVKLINVPGLSWLIVPRLVVRTGFGITTFHAGDPAVLARFRLLAHGN